MVVYAVNGQDSKNVDINCCKILDISRYGMRMECVELLKKGDSVRAQIHTAKETINVRGKVVHRSNSIPGLYGIGIEFDRSYPEIDAIG
jgi:hypothetical protein